MAKVYGPAFICKVFGVTRTTLFRWEKTIQNFPIPSRNNDNERGYTKEQIKAIIKCVGPRQKQKMLSSFQAFIKRRESKTDELRQFFEDISK